MEATFRQFKNKVESWPGWEECKTIVLAISGGVDSMVLLHLMIELVQLNEYRDRQLVVAHFNHRLRSPETHDKEQTLVVNTAKSHQLVYFVSKWESPSKSNIEANARQARYQFLADVLDASKGDCLMTAHHLDDAVETMFMRMIRGTSLKGLTGIRDNYQRVMKASNNEITVTALMRPLINFRKAELYQYAENHQIVYYEDESNHETEYLRNRIRKQYLPKIELENPQFYHNLFAMQQQLTSSYQAHYETYMCQEPLLLAKLEDKRWAFDVKKWRELSDDFREVFLTIFFEERFIEVAGQYDKEAISHLLDQILNTETPNYRFNLAPGWVSRREYDYIFIEPEERKAPALSDYRVDLSTNNKWFSLGNGLWIGLFNRSFVNNQMRKAVDDFLALDLSEEENPPAFHIRHRQDGDLIELKSSKGAYHKKISRILIDEKIPSSVRDKIWLIVNDTNEVIWMIGHQSSSKYQPQKPENITHYLLIQKMY
ncbi:tRNA lysidine(34) synthetase TilS [Facklamia sp. P12945]|uniref:tRNA lysidine(34) synthetase TilS n=1 Tax=unclassified Facklamia TaxID=2622293 RepID=UPI003D16BE15